MDLKSDIQQVLHSIVIPKSRSSSSKVSKEVLLQVFLEASEPEKLSLSDVTQSYSKAAKQPHSDELVRAIGKSLRDISRWIDDSQKRGQSDVSFGFRVNQVGEPLIELRSDNQEEFDDLTFIELIPDAVEKAFHVNLPVPDSLLKGISERHHWLASLFPARVLAGKCEQTIDTIARSVSQLLMGRVREQIASALIHSETVHHIFFPEPRESSVRAVHQRFIRTLLSESLHAASLDVGIDVQLGSVKHVAVVSEDKRASFSDSSLFEELRSLRKRGQLVYFADPNDLPIDSQGFQFPVLTIGTRCFISFPSKGAPNECRIENGVNAIGEENRRLLADVMSSISQGEMLAIDATDSVAWPTAS